MASRVFVGFSSTDKHYFDLMKAWKNHEHIDFDFIDLQLDTGINSDNEDYIKRLLREKITSAGTFIQLIGSDTKNKHKYVRWEAEVAIEKNCRLIGVNLNKLMQIDNNLTPPILKDKGAIFVPYSPKIIQYTLNHFQAKKDSNWHYEKSTYDKLGINNDGTRIS